MNEKQEKEYNYYEKNDSSLHFITRRLVFQIRRQHPIKRETYREGNPPLRRQPPDV